jgi:tetratricopeptide (TPR) repeat protein
MPRLLAKPQAAYIAALSFVLCPLSFVRALDPELTTPYKVQVVLRVAPDRVFTPIFKEQLRRDLSQGLQAALGAMGEVEVIDLGEVAADKWEPLWKEVAAKGLQSGLDGSVKAISSVKTHFVTVDYADGQYEIQARQYDGLTGLASPTARHERTPDRQFVARTAALLVDRDFGIVGTVAGGDGQTSRVVFKGGGLKVPLDRWVKKGDVFALVQVGADGRSVRVPWTLLQADAAPGEDGACQCKVLPPQRPGAGGVELRCLKLGTIKAPVRLRVMEGGQKGKPPRVLKDTAVVSLGRHGFNDARQGLLVTDAEGFGSTESGREEGLYDGVAFATVKVNGQVRTQVVLALVDDRTITVPILLGPEDPLVLRQRALWEQALLNERVTLNELFKSLNEEIGKASNAAVRERAHKAVESLGERLLRYSEQHDELAKMKPLPGAKPLNLAQGEALLAYVRIRLQDLKDFVARMDAILKDTSAAGQEAKALNEQAQNFEKAGDYDRAIDLYEKVLAKADDARLKERLKKLKEAWQPRGDAHREARAFIYNTWPKLESANVMKERVGQAQEALTVCRKVKDPFGPRKVLAVTRMHTNRVEQQVKALPDDPTEQERKQLEELAEVLKGLEKLAQQAQTDVTQTPVP